MRFKLLLLTFFTLGLSNAELNAQCSKAEAYVARVKAADNWTPTKRVNSGNKVQGWSQLGAWHAYKCECDKGGRTPEEAENLKNGLNQIQQTIVSQYSDAGEIPPVITNCKSGSQTGDSGGQLNNKTATQIEMENRFKNYNTAMNLKGQGEAIAKAFAEQVKQFGQMGYAANPQEQLDNFNHNMQQIAQMQSQNKADNLNQLDNTVGTTLNQLNAGNREGAMYSTLSLIDQRYEQKQAKKEAEKQKQNLIAQQQQKMSQFYWKAVELNNQAINNYLQIAAYSFSKADEDFNIAYAGHHRCFGRYMKKNYSYTSTAWTRNNCSKPVKTSQVENNLVAKDIQYINAAKRKFKWFEESNNEDFREGAMRFAGAAATENPKAEYYYLMGHYAGVVNPIVAYTSFEAAQSLEPNYFTEAKAGEYYIVSQALQASFKESIESNNQKIIKEIIASQLHNAVKIEGQPAIIYAIKVDQPDVVQLFLNDYANGKSQTIINTKVQEVIMMAAVLDAPNTIQRFVDLGFSVDFELNGKSPVLVAEEAIAIKALEVLLNHSSKKMEYEKQFISNHSKALTYSKIIESADKGDSIVFHSILTNELTTIKIRKKLVLDLLQKENKDGFFWLIEADQEILKDKELTTIIFINEMLNVNKTDVWKFIKYDLVILDETGRFSKEHATYLFLESLNNAYNRSPENAYDYNLMEFAGSNLFSKDRFLEMLEENSSLINYYDPLEFAMYFKKDVALCNILSQYQGRSKIVVSNRRLFSLSSYYSYNLHPQFEDLKSKGKLKRGVREFEILEILLKSDKISFEVGYPGLLGAVIECTLVGDENGYEKGKELIDYLISKGYQTNLHISNYSKKSYLNQPWEIADKKYWKSLGVL